MSEDDQIKNDEEHADEPLTRDDLFCVWEFDPWDFDHPRKLLWELRKRLDGFDPAPAKEKYIRSIDLASLSEIINHINDKLKEWIMEEGPKRFIDSRPDRTVAIYQQNA